MFNDVPYTSINREERHFGFLLGSAIIHNHEFADFLFSSYNKLIGSDLDSREFEIFFEVAALRDYWCDLGNSLKYSPDTHLKRRQVLDLILEQKGYEQGLIDQEKVFWTNGKIATGKLWCPSEWDIKRIEETRKN